MLSKRRRTITLHQHADTDSQNEDNCYMDGF